MASPGTQSENTSTTIAEMPDFEESAGKKKKAKLLESSSKKEKPSTKASKSRISSGGLRRVISGMVHRTLAAAGVVEKPRSTYAERKKERVGRKPFRQANKMGVDRYRYKFMSLEPLDLSTGKIHVPENFKPHNGVHNMGQWQLEFLKSHGLKPSHSLLDVGCGDLRGGILFVRYLERGNYTGVDQAEIAIRQGLLSADETVLRKDPRFFVGGDFGFEQTGTRFDFLWAHSVLSHVDLSITGKCIESAFSVLRPGGVFLASFFPGPGERPFTTPQLYRDGSAFTQQEEKYTYGYRNPYHHPVSLLRQIAEETGFHFEVVEEKTPKGQTIIKLSKTAEHLV